MVAKSFPLKQGSKKNWSQKHFLENRFARKYFSEKLFEKIFLSIIFYGCKMISTKTGFQKKCLRTLSSGRNYFIVAK
jgi:hypothetical protein